MMHENRVFGKHLRQYRDNKTISRGIKSGSLTVLWGTISVSLIVVWGTVWLQVMLLTIAVAVSVHLARLPVAEAWVEARPASR